MKYTIARILLGGFLCACGKGDGGDGGGDGTSGDDPARSDNPATELNGTKPTANGVILCPDRDKYKHVYFGDLHTHTAYSADAFGFTTRNDPTDAWAFARGKALRVAAAAATPGPMVTIEHQLDFDAITDHSEWLAVAYSCGVDIDGKPVDPKSPFGAQCASFTSQSANGLQAIRGASAVLRASCGKNTEESGVCLQALQSAWKEEQQAANAAYMPCSFTSLIAYEWTHADPSNKATLHKNVIFADEHVPDHPFDATDYPTATDLWSALDQWLAEDPSCKAGAPCAALTIPHNSNKSQGEAFLLPDTASGIDQMQRYQKLVEIHQHKGNSECFYDPATPNKDVSCNFEHLTPTAKEPLDRANYVRTALENGLISYAAGGVNPLQLGIVGATDDHNGMPGSVAEDNWHGHAGLEDYGTLERLSKSIDKNPGGITGVWAEENTRPSIFAALSRRETYATSGVFIPVRFYQTWDETDFCTGGFPQNIVDANGIPMGGNMTAGNGKKPWFYVSAAKDEADLAEVHIVKGTLKNGKAVESVKAIKAPSPGALCVRWQDADFDPQAPTFYYGRVLQAPTPRWSHFDCQKAGAPAGCEPGGPLDVNIQERAWTSPIWSLP